MKSKQRGQYAKSKDRTIVPPTVEKALMNIQRLARPNQDQTLLAIEVLRQAGYEIQVSTGVTHDGRRGTVVSVIYPAVSPSVSDLPAS